MTSRERNNVFNYRPLDFLLKACGNVIIKASWASITELTIPLTKGQ